MNKDSESQFSTPSRGSSPQGSEESRRSTFRPTTSSSAIKPTRGRGRGRGRKPGNTSTRGRGKYIFDFNYTLRHSCLIILSGYNTSAYHESEYHYGSDFGDSSDNKSDIEDDVLLSRSESEESLAQRSDSDFSLSSFSATSLSLKRSQQSGTSPPSPEPIWIQDREVPPLELPKSSDDLLLPKKHVLKATAIYEIIRRFRNLVRLSPFRLEDFCAAIVCEEQSTLLAEIHIMLLKAILREEDSQQTHFGPLDQKDSVNISLYLLDSITWPEVLRIYVESDNSFDNAILSILVSKEYPYTSAEERLQVLQFLTDQFLITTSVRDDMLQEGPIHYDDHCRICHRLGDLLCCETCPAVFHLECVDPPLIDVPTEDWQCNICKTHKVVGVADCISSNEKQGLLCRQEHLGFDRAGRKYWFVARRLFVETEDESEIWYYSSGSQLDYLISKFDPTDYEDSLCKQLEDYKDEMKRQMKITELLTNQFKGNKKSYFELEQQRIEKAKEEGLSESQENANTDESEMEVDVKSNDPTRQDDSENENPANGISATPGNKNIITRSKTGSLTPRTFSIDDLKRKGSRDESDPDSRLTRNKLNQISNGTLFFKLGQENNFKTYVNQYAINPITLNKPQRNEERDKKRHLSHKFSLTQASEFKWIGNLNGSQANVVSTIKQTVLSFEQSITSSFMHCNWPKLRKTWVAAVTNCSTYKDFARVLIVLQACLKSVVFANVWHEQLGHIKLYRITSMEREEKKKLEKREKREKEDEEERNRLAINFVKYSLGLKHQVWKQKGEEYRIHGQWGWLWMSYCRRNKDFKAVSVIEPQSIIIPIKKNGLHNIVSMNKETYDHLVGEKNNGNSEKMFENVDDVELVKVIDVFAEINVSDALTSKYRIFYPKIAKKSQLDDILARRIKLKEMEEANTQIPKILNNINPNITIKRVETTTAAGTNISMTSKSSNDLEKYLNEIVNSKSSNNTATATNNNQNSASPVVNPVLQQNNLEALNIIRKRIQTVRINFGQLTRLIKHNKCYSRDCNFNSNVISFPVTTKCYSPLCIQKTRVQNELAQLLKKAQQIGGKKPSILEQKLTENNKLDDNNIMNLLSSDDSLKSSKGKVMEVDHVIRTSEFFDYNGTLSCISEKSIVKPEPEEVSAKVEKDVKPNNPASTSAVATPPEKMEIDDVDVVEIPSKIDPVVEKKDVVEVKEERRGRGRSARINNLKHNDHDTSAAEKDKSGLNNKHFPEFRSHTNRRFGTKLVKKDDFQSIEKELYPDGRPKIYAANSTKGKIYLKKSLQSEGINIKVTTIKYPIVSNFDTKLKTKSIMVLPNHELVRLARNGGKTAILGFNNQAKTNTSVWPYPCSRPLFKTCWLYRTINLKTLSSVGLHLRIIWACLRWDDMAAKPANTDGKHQVTTDTEIMSLELLKHRYVGLFMERTQYLRRKVVIPLELPKTIRGKLVIIFLNFNI